MEKKKHSSAIILQWSFASFAINKTHTIFRFTVLKGYLHHSDSRTYNKYIRQVYTHSSSNYYKMFPKQIMNQQNNSVNHFYKFK